MTADHSRMTVYDGRTAVGHVVEQRGKFVAYDSVGRQIGSFIKMRDAMRAVPSPKPATAVR